MGIGGGTITRKLLFAVLLITSLSLAGIAGVSAANVGTTQTQAGNNHTVQKNVKIVINTTNIVNRSTITQRSVDKIVKHVKKAHSNKKIIRPNVNNSKTATMFNKNSVKTTNNTVRQNTAQKIVPKYAYGTTKYKKVAYKKWYRYHGKWRYKIIYKYKKVRATINRKHSKANSSSIRALARSLTKGVHSQYMKGAKIFNWVRDNLAYSFYYNTRYGASGALKYRKGNCVDTSHLVIALARSAGLKARYISGDVRFRSGHVYGHVWAQIWANGRWHIADATSSWNRFGVMRNGIVLRLKGYYNRLPF